MSEDENTDENNTVDEYPFDGGFSESSEGGIAESEEEAADSVEMFEGRAIVTEFGDDVYRLEIPKVNALELLTLLAAENKVKATTKVIDYVLQYNDVDEDATELLKHSDPDVAFNAIRLVHMFQEVNGFGEDEGGHGHGGRVIK